ncbi:hypothetical protein SPONN_1309 [uncultured Candidatus Thioglobus sp.]|nr:hypothetical protein SPONN_1309 [uncultured Candidatus Thioglobus sp.]
MTLSKTDILELKKIQPELVLIENKISGCFYLSASIENKSKNRGKRINCHSWNYESSNNKHIHDYFDVNITLNEDSYPIQVFSKKILSWKDKIPEEYWHVNPDNSLCLGEIPDILEEQKKYSFEKFINMLLMQYFYYMHYTKGHLKEPWKAYTHSLFYILEVAANSKDVRNDLILLNKYIDAYKEEWNNLLNKTQKQKIKNKHNCPFCHHKKLAKNCNEHKKQIKGYNKLVPFLQK